MSCLGLYFIPSSLACHVYFMLYSIVSLRCFIFCLSFIFSFILHPSCIILLLISSFLSILPLDSFVYSWQKGGEYIGEYTGVFCHFYMTIVHILKGKNFTSWTFVRGESHRGDAYTKGEMTSCFEKTLFCFVLYFSCFLVALWCFELRLVSLLCCSYCIMLMCWICIHPYIIVLYWLHVRMIIYFTI